MPTKRKSDHFNPPDPISLKFEIAALFLAELKENFSYRAFFRDLKEDPYTVWPVLKRPGESQSEWQERMLTPNADESSNWIDVFEQLNLSKTWLIESQLCLRDQDSNTESILNLLDPDCEIDKNSTDSFAIETLPYLFSSRRVRLIDKKSVVFHRHLKPHEKLLLLDFRCSKAELKIQFNKLIDEIFSLQTDITTYSEEMSEELLSKSIEFLENNISLEQALSSMWSGIDSHRNMKRSKYRELPQPLGEIMESVFEPYDQELFDYLGDPRPRNTWHQDISRISEEKRWESLEVWKLRAEKKPYSEIGQLLNIPADSARKKFYSAYKNTQNEEYDHCRWKEYANQLNTERLTKYKGLCGSCRIHSECKELCPPALEYMTQDEKSSTRETLSRTDRQEP